MAAFAPQVGLGTNIVHRALLWPASSERDELVAAADGFAQVIMDAACCSLVIMLRLYTEHANARKHHRVAMHAWTQVLNPDKMEVVRLLRARGHVVGITGEGVGDTTALAAAQVDFVA